MTTEPSRLYDKKNVHGGNAKALVEIMLSDSVRTNRLVQPWSGKGYLPVLYIGAYTNTHMFSLSPSR